MKKILGISTKQKGVSMIIALAVSFIIVGVSLSILFLSKKYQIQSQKISLSNQTFFTLEAAKEAALFHHNARRQGFHSFQEVEIAPPSQTIEFSPTNKVKWGLRGRTANLPNPEVLTGILKENQVVQIPFFWDESENISQTPSTKNITNFNFELAFSRYTFDSDGNPTSNEIIKENFDFGAENNEILINWTFSKTDSSGNLKTFIPKSDFEGFIYCDSIGSVTGFFCETNFGEKIQLGLSIPGYILPGKELTTLDDFYSDDNAGNDNFMISFQPILSFIDSDGMEKIKGIPWALRIINAPNEGFPKHYYEIEIQANIGDFEKTLFKTIFEKTSIENIDTTLLE